MVSDASKKKAAQKKAAAAAAKRGGKVVASSSSSSSKAQNSGVADDVTNGVSELMISDRTCTGVLCSHPLSRDIRIESLSVTFHGHDLIVDSELEHNYERLDGKHVVFGKVLSGLDVVYKIEAEGRQSGTPKSKVVITGSGEVPL